MAVKKVFIHTAKAKAAFAPSAARAGRALFQEGRVLRTFLQEGEELKLHLIGEVEDDEANWRVEVTFHRLTAALLSSHCQCSVRRLCAHAYAALLHFEAFNKEYQSSTGIIDVTSHLEGEKVPQFLDPTEPSLGEGSGQPPVDVVNLMAAVVEGEERDSASFALQMELEPPVQEGLAVYVFLDQGDGKRHRVNGVAALCQALLHGHPYRLGRGVRSIGQEDLTPEAVESLFLLNRYLQRSPQGEFLGEAVLAPFLWKVLLLGFHGIHFAGVPLIYDPVPLDKVLTMRLRGDRALFELSYRKEQELIEADHVFMGCPSAVLAKGRVFFTREGIPIAQRRLCLELARFGLEKGMIPTFLDKIRPRLEEDVTFQIDDSVWEWRGQEEVPSVELQVDTLGHDFSLKAYMLYGRYRAPFNHTALPVFPVDMTAVRDLSMERRVARELLGDAKFHEANQCFVLPRAEFGSFFARFGIQPPQWLRLSLTDRVDKLLRRSELTGKLQIQQTVNRHFFEVTFSCPDLQSTISVERLRLAMMNQERVVTMEKDQGFLILNQLPNSQWLDMLEVADFDELKDGVKATIPKWGLVALMGGELKEWVDADGKTHQAYQKMVCDPREIHRSLPQSFKGELRPYQEQGFQWLVQLHAAGLHGILADDMGLGKTVQAIALLASEKESNPTAKTLIVCPTSLVVNWYQEIVRFAPGLSVRLVHGSQDERASLLHKLDGVDVLVTSYATLQRDIEHYRAHTFHFLILDEAQHIKNPSTRNARTAKSIEAEHRLVLTGTPIENSAKDLWSLFDFLMPGFLHSQKAFAKRYLITGHPRGEREGYERLKARIRPFVLRRIKEDVLQDLPPITHMVSRCEMGSLQKAFYLQILREVISSVDEAVAAQGEQQSKLQILAAITRLKQVCCHPQLVGMGVEQLGSAKMDLLMELIYEMVDGGHRAVVFSQYVKMLKLIRHRLDKEKIPYCYLDGSTKDRQGEVDRFNHTAEIPLFLVSLKAGGTGLNLIGADRVIHYDLWWNPSVEDQATDRVHRIGQTRQVMSYKLVTNGTIEDKILQLQEEKRELLDCVINQSEQLLSQISWEELRQLLLVP